jgi:hypothetical protein
MKAGEKFSPAFYFMPKRKKPLLHATLAEIES